MKLSNNRIPRAWPALLASALALSMVACEQQSSPEQVGKDIARAVENARDQAAQSADQAKEATGDATAEAGKTLDDAAVTAKVKSALVAEPGLKSLTINVDTTAGIVTLRGTADSPESRVKAEQLAMNVEGVRSVTNEIVVVKGS